jgi:hypothetical protein
LEGQDDEAGQESEGGKDSWKDMKTKGRQDSWKDRTERKNRKVKEDNSITCRKIA